MPIVTTTRPIVSALVVYQVKSGPVIKLGRHAINKRAYCSFIEVRPCLIVEHINVGTK